jgi:phosphoglycerol transferase MdoB-like AlkP superfamily enzyme
MRVRWDRFFLQAQRDVKLWVFFMLLFTAGRIFFLWFFRDRMTGTDTLVDFLKIFLVGARFDCMTAGYFVFPSFLGSVACGFFDWERGASKFRLAFAGVCFTIAVFFIGIDLGFFREFNERINTFLFQFFIDDTKALVVTIWKDYHPIVYFSAMGAIVALGMIALRRLLRNPWFPAPSFDRRAYGIAARVLITVVLTAGLIVSARGSFGSVPFHRKSLAITEDEFLNKSVFNVFTSLRYAIKDFIALTHSDKGLDAFLPDRDVVGAAQFAFHTTARYDNLDDYSRKTAGGGVPRPPRHIFLVIGESYDSWPMLDKYRSLGLMENLKEFAREGISIPYFLPAGDLTMLSLATIITGLPDSGILINNHLQSRKPYAGSLAVAFNKLGYRTRFFYGGYPTWQRVSEFVRDQGFEEVYDAESLAASETKNPWGVDDRELFDLVVKKVDDSKPSLDVILTTNNHTPFPIDVWAKGFRLYTIPPELVTSRDRVISRKVLGHIWYTDQCVGDFVRGMERRMPMSLFVITGDHYGRNFLTSRPNLFEESAVPLVLYGPDVVPGLARPKSTVGCHLDIMPTLVEMVAPEGFAYHAIGRNLLDPSGFSPGIGRTRVITPDCLVDTGSKPARVFPLTVSGCAQSVPELKKFHDSLLGVAWWRVKYGPMVNGKH